MKIKTDLTQTDLKEVLTYNPDSGVFTWAKHVNSRAKKGARAGSVNNNGYRRITICESQYLAHRLAWLYMTGEWPAEQIDHINMDISDNSWINLREASHTNNFQNKGMYSNNKSGYKGVSWNKQDKGWRAQIQVNGKKKHLGCFKVPEEAHKAYCEAADKHFGEFANFG